MTRAVLLDFYGTLARSDDRLPQNLEASKFFQSKSEINLFADEKLFVESAGSVEIRPCRKKERTRAQIIGETEAHAICSGAAAD